MGINNWDPRGMTSTAVLLEEIKNVSAGEVRSLGSLLEIQARSHSTISLTSKEF